MEKQKTQNINAATKNPVALVCGEAHLASAKLAFTIPSRSKSPMIRTSVVS